MRLFILFITFCCAIQSLKSQIFFEDISESSGIAETGPNYGIAVADYDKDGWEDVYITRWIGPNRLYRNLGNESFEEVALKEGVAFTGSSKIATWGDINNDGWLDLFVGNQEEPDVLYLNKGEVASVRDEAQFERVDLPFLSSQAAGVMAALWTDIDQDSFLDLYIVRSTNGNTLYKNNGDLTFTDITEEANVSDDLLSMGAIFFDYDNDGDQDLYLVHDGYQPNILYENDGKGYFQDVAPQINADSKSFGMGVDMADINRDGWLDIYISNLYGNTLLLNQEGKSFSDISIPSGTTDQGMGWGTAFFDYDNDGWQDIYVANTIGDPNVLYKNLKDLTFQRTSDQHPLALAGSSFGIATSDFNQDGWIDIWVANSQDDIGSKLFKNTSEYSHNWIEVICTGTYINHLAIGSRIEVWTNGQLQIDEINAGTGYAGQNSFMLHFGLGSAEQVDSLIIRWAGGNVEKMTNLEVNRIYQVKEGQGISTHLDNMSENFPFLIYPNPVKETFKLRLTSNVSKLSGIKLHSFNNEVIELFDSTHPLSVNMSLLNFDISALSNGMYIMEVVIGDERYYQKLLKISH